MPRNIKNDKMLYEPTTVSLFNLTGRIQKIHIRSLFHEAAFKKDTIIIIQPPTLGNASLIFPNVFHAYYTLPSRFP